MTDGCAEWGCPRSGRWDMPQVLPFDDLETRCTVCHRFGYHMLGLGALRESGYVCDLCCKLQYGGFR